MSFDLSPLLEGTEWEAYQRWLDAPVAEGDEGEDAVISQAPLAELADLARGDLTYLRAVLSGQGTSGTSLTAQLDARLDTERQDTLLTWAARHGQAEAVRLLLEGGASVGATTGGVHRVREQLFIACECALSIACENNHVEIARLLLEAGAAVNQANEKGFTPLFMACQEGHLECAQLLIEASAAISQAADGGWTPLYAACCKGHLEIARLLLEASAAIDQATRDGATPLLGACIQGHLEVAKLLSSYGASRRAYALGTPEEVALGSYGGGFHGRKHADLAAWLVASRGWTPLQHLEALTVDRARALLRGGANSSAGEPSALERARVLCAWGESDPTAAAVGSTVAIHSLVSRPSMNGKVGVVVSANVSTGRFGVRVAGEAKALALRPANLQPAAEAVEVGRLILKAAEWSPQSHELFPEPARKWAVAVMRLGYLIAWDEERFDGEGAAPGLVELWRGFVLPRVVARAAAADAPRSP